MRKEMIALGVCAATLAVGGMAFAAEVSSPEMEKAAPVTMPTFEKFDPTKYEGPAGTLVFPGKEDVQMTLLKSDAANRMSYIIVESKKPSFKLPVGQYKLSSYGRTYFDKDGTGWSLVGVAADPSKPVLLDIKAAKTLKLKIGAPLSASVRVTQKDAKTVAMDLAVLGQGGDRCLIVKNGSAMEAPGFEVVSDSGAVVMSGKFQYG